MCGRVENSREFISETPTALRNENYQREYQVREEKKMEQVTNRIINAQSLQKRRKEDRSGVGIRWIHRKPRSEGLVQVKLIRAAPPIKRRLKRRAKVWSSLKRFDIWKEEKPIHRIYGMTENLVISNSNAVSSSRRGRMNLQSTDSLSISTHRKNKKIEYIVAPRLSSRNEKNRMHGSEIYIAN